MKDAGFDERESRGIVQAVVDTTASLGLFTSSEWRHWEKRYEQDQELNQKQHDLALARIVALEKTVDKIYLWIRWGFGILFAFMLFLSSRIG